MSEVENKHQARLGAVQQTLFIPLAARARETQRKHPVLRDPRAVELVRSVDYDTAKYGLGAGGPVTVLRTAMTRTPWSGSGSRWCRPPRSPGRRGPCAASSRPGTGT